MGAWAVALPALAVVAAAGCRSGSGTAPDASPEPDGAPGSDAPAPPPSEPVSGTGPEAAALRGIGQLRDQMTCTAFLVQPGTNPDAPALAITNGHCVEDWASQDAAHDVVIDAPPSEGAQVRFNYFHDTQSAQVIVDVARIRYATMKRRDVAVLELGATVNSLAQRGVMPVPIAAAAPGTGALIRVIGVPLLGGLEDSFLRSARCTAEGQARIVEYFWYWPAMARNFCADIVGGSSGSPVLDEQGRAFATANTTTRDSPPDAGCHLGSPCELRPTGAVRLDDASYAVDVTWLPRCAAPDGRFDPAAAGCPLDLGRQLGVDGAPFARSRPTATWGVVLSEASGFGHVRYKAGPAITTDCGELAGYAAPQPVAAQPVTGLAVPTDEGPALLCILGGTGASLDPAVATWQPPEHATTVVTTIDATPPQRRPRLAVFDAPDTRATLRIEPIFEVPELSSFEYVVDPSRTVDCAGAGLAWQRYRRFPFPVPATARLCIRASDLVDNLGPAWTYDPPFTSTPELRARRRAIAPL